MIGKAMLHLVTSFVNLAYGVTISIQKILLWSKNNLF